MKNVKETLAKTEAARKEQYTTVLTVSLIFGVFSTLFSNIGQAGTGLVIAILWLIFSGPMAIGYADTFLMLARGEKVSVNSLFAPYKGDRCVTYILYSIRRDLYLFGWFLLLIVPGFMKYYAYAMAPFILIDHPEMTGKEAIEASKNVMEGKKADLFKLTLRWVVLLAAVSVVGSLLLRLFVPRLGAGASDFLRIFITAMIGFVSYIIIRPRVHSIEASFYEALKDEVK